MNYKSIVAIFISCLVVCLMSCGKNIDDKTGKDIINEYINETSKVEVFPSIEERQIILGKLLEKKGYTINNWNFFLSKSSSLNSSFQDAEKKAEENLTKKITDISNGLKGKVGNYINGVINNSVKEFSLEKILNDFFLEVKVPKDTYFKSLINKVELKTDIKNNINNLKNSISNLENVCFQHIKKYYSGELTKKNIPASFFDPFCRRVAKEIIGQKFDANNELLIKDLVSLLNDVIKKEPKSKIKEAQTKTLINEIIVETNSSASKIYSDALPNINKTKDELEGFIKILG